jgi:hypothetical protein
MTDVAVYFTEEKEYLCVISAGKSSALSSLS